MLSPKAMNAREENRTRDGAGRRGQLYVENQEGSTEMVSKGLGELRE